MNAAMTFVALALSLASMWVTVLWTMPAVARARVQRQAESARDRIIDCMLSGDIDYDNPSAHEVLMFSHVLEAHSRELTLSSAVATSIAIRRGRIDVHAENAEYEEHLRRESKGMATRRGELVLTAVSRYQVRILAYYFVRGSAFWWFLIPLQWLSWLLHSRHVPAAQEISHAIDQPLPGDIAREVREASRGLHVPADMWGSFKSYANVA